MGRSSRHGGNARRYRIARPKDFRMHSISADAPSHKAPSQVMQKRGRSAQVEIRATRHAKLLDHGHVKVSGCIEVGSKPVLWTWPAVPYVATAMSQPLEQAPGLLEERVLITVARSIQPPDFARRRPGSQDM